MLRVIGPALIDTSVERTVALAGLDEEDVVDVFAEAMMARGPLPAIRFGKNPYGLLPVTALGGLKPLASDNANVKKIETFIRDFASLVIDGGQRAADELVPVIEPSDPAAAEKLEDILKQHPVSRRIEVSSAGQADSRVLGCAYVNNDAHPVSQYLADLRRLPLGQLPDPPATDTTYPLLYRLARLGLTKATTMVAIQSDPTFVGTRLSLRREADRGTEAEALQAVGSRLADHSLSSLAAARQPRLGIIGTKLRRVSARYLAGLERLEQIASLPDGTARLEMLMMETIDLFQHRMDAWATGLAYRRLVKRRRAGLTGLQGGYWGMIGKLRPLSATGRTDGYVQAPSVDQAATAGILRSANLRHGGAFAIGLDSASVRKGQALLELLQTGIGPGEALGYLGERILHDAKRDVYIARLRTLFPIRDPRDEASLEIRLFDGLKFLKANIATLVTGAEAPHLTELQHQLSAHFDALSDIVMAEAVHLRRQGRGDAAGAWLQVLSGETIPGPASVLRTRRTGHGSSHRVVVLLEPAEPASDATPRASAEPALAALSAARLTGFGTAAVSVQVEGSESFEFKLKDHLGLVPIDLLVGGRSEIELRARHSFVLRWISDNSLHSVLGPPPEREIAAALRDLQATVVYPSSIEGLLDDAAALARAIKRGRELEPGDLSAAADPSTPLTDVAERDLLIASTAQLQLRATALRELIVTAAGALSAAAGQAISAAREFRRQRDLAADSGDLALAFGQLELAKTTLDLRLVSASRFGMPGALLFASALELSEEPDRYEREFTAIIATLQAKGGKLAASTAAPPTDARTARIARSELLGAIREALDGSSLPILPPLPRVAEITPLLGTPRPTIDAIGEWGDVREKVGLLRGAFGSGAWQTYISLDAATGADDPDADARTDESVAPRARLFGLFVSESDPAEQATFVGFVADEWAETRPSRMQTTGIAINYDAPQCEAPQAILLCEPSGPAPRGWTEAAAANMVAEVIRLMKVRALSSQQRPLNRPLLPGANQVPHLPANLAPGQPRIPIKPYRFLAPLGGLDTDATFFTAPAAGAVGRIGAGFNEVSGYGAAED
jgi:hypothetical protein